MTYPSLDDDSGYGSYGHSSQGQSPYGPGMYHQPGYGAPAGGAGCPPSNVGWAVASILFFWPLSFVAMTRALQVYPLWAAGNHEQAQAASSSAKKLGVISLAIMAIFIVLYIIFVATMVGVTATGF